MERMQKFLLDREKAGTLRSLEPLTRLGHGWVRLLDSDNDAPEQLVAIEGTEHLLECYQRDTPGGEPPRRFLQFKVFDDQSSIARRRDLRGRRRELHL